MDMDKATVSIHTNNTSERALVQHNDISRDFIGAGNSCLMYMKDLIEMLKNYLTGSHRTCSYLYTRHIECLIN